MDKLQKPVFVKVEKLVDCRDGYNVYVKVLSAEHSTSQNGEQKFVRAVVGDETGIANAFFKGDAAEIIQKDSVVAIRNGKIKLIKNHISLEIDIFGRVTKENVEVKPKEEHNISEKEISRPKRRPPRHNDGERKPRREDGDRRPRREEGERVYNREPRFREERQRQDRPRREEGDRKPRRDFDRPKRDYEEAPRRDQKPRIEWTKIGAIEPGEDMLNMTAKVISIDPVKDKVRVMLGDDTGIVKGFFPKDEALKEGNIVVIFKGEAAVVKEHIEIMLMRGGRVEESRNKKFIDVDDSVNISAKAWVQSS